MESVFPQLFYLSFFVPLVLRIGAAIAFALLAQNLYRRRSEIAVTRFPIIGTPSMTLVRVKVAAISLIALFLLIGLWVQVVAILGFVAGVKCWLFAKRYPTILPHGRVAYFLLAIICLSLLVTGAGGFAFDLPF